MEKMEVPTRPKLYVGIDLGATNAKAGVVNEDGLLLGSHQVPLSSGSSSSTESHQVDHVVKLLVECVHLAVKSAQADWETVIAVGVGSPGHVYNGVVKAASNFPVL
jgi:sugar (pentulose or hexulose) kinase